MPASYADVAFREWMTLVYVVNNHDGSFADLRAKERARDTAHGTYLYFEAYDNA